MSTTTTPDLIEPTADGAALRVWIAVRSALLTVAAALGVLSIAGSALLLCFGLRPQIVISGSMEPTIPTGSLAFARTIDAVDIQERDIVTVPRNFGSGLVTHRVIAAEPAAEGATSLTLRGDANASADPRPYTVTTAGLVTFHLPGLGYLARTLQTGYGLVGLGLIALCFTAAFVFEPARLRRWSAGRD